MKKRMFPMLPLGIVLALIIVVALFFFWRQSLKAEASLAEALSSYEAGEKASSIGQRQADFNKALALYMALEETYQPIYGNGKLYYNIGNTYFQLEQYPHAILYYSRALNLMPQDVRIARNLELAQSKLGIAPASDQSVFSQIFFFHTRLATPEKLQFFFCLSVLWFILASFHIWRPDRWLKTGIFVVGLLVAVLFASLAYTYYLSPTEAIIVRGTAFYRDAGEQYAKVMDTPILPGTKVQVLDVLQNGTWLKITTPDGTLGYIPNPAARII